MPRSTAEALQRSGYVASDVRDIGFDATPDDEIFNHAQAIGAVIVTRDVGFGSSLDYPLGTHSGIIVLRIPTQVTTDHLISLLLHAVEDLADELASGSLVIVEPGRTRIRVPDHSCDMPLP